MKRRLLDLASRYSSVLWDRRAPWRLVPTAWLAVQAVSNIVVASGAHPEWNDFAGFYLAGRVISEGITPYGPAPDLAGVTDQDGKPSWPFGGPPPNLFLFQALSVLPYDQARPLWFALSVVFYAGLLVALTSHRSVYDRALFIAWGLACVAFKSTLALGQLYVLLAVLVALVVSPPRRHGQLISGLALGLLVALKPNFAVWPIALILSGRTALGLVAAGWAGIAFTAAALVYGPVTYIDWLAGGAAGYVNGPMTYNGSVFVVANLFGHPEATQPVGLVLAALLCMGLWALSAFSHLSPNGLAQTSLVVGLLASPLAWPGYLLLLVPLLARQRWRFTSAVVAVTMLMPFTAFLPLLLALFDGLRAEVRRASLAISSTQIGCCSLAANSEDPARQTP